MDMNSLIIKDPKKYGNEISIKELADIISNAQKSYHEDGKPILSDKIYDILIEILENRDPDNALLSFVGSDVVGEKSKLPYYLGSLDKVKPDSSKLNTWLKKYKGPYMITDKEDGISCLLVNKDNSTYLYTRGNGKEGTDISFIQKYIKLPNLNNTKNKYLTDYESVAVRGELIISKENFKKYEKKDNDNTGYSNARNMVCGVVRSGSFSNKKSESLKDIEFNILKDIEFITYELIYPRYKSSLQFEILKDINFKIVENSMHVELNVKILQNILSERRKLSDYEIDGIVITDNNNHVINESKNPKHSIAFKMDTDDQIYDTEIIDIIWEPDCSGKLQPVAIIKEVTIGGAKINKAYANNARNVITKGIGIGAKIKIIRSGDVIPKILEVLQKVKPTYPKEDFEWDKNKVHLVLKDKNHPVVKLKCLIKFFNTINVSDFGEGTIKACYENGIDTIDKIITSSVVDFLKIPKIKDKKATKIYESIKKSIVEASLAQIISGTNIFGDLFGKTRIQLILNNIPGILNFTENSDIITQKISNIDSLKETTAMAFVENIENYKEFFKNSPELKKIVDEKYNSKSVKNENTKISKLLDGNHYLFSGIRDKKLEDLIKNHCGIIPNSNKISNKITILIVNDINKKTSKVTSAEELNIPIMEINEFRKYINNFLDKNKLSISENLKENTLPDNENKFSNNENIKIKKCPPTKPEPPCNEGSEMKEKKYKDGTISKCCYKSKINDEKSFQKKNQNIIKNQNDTQNIIKNQNDTQNIIDNTQIRECPPTKPEPPCNEGSEMKEKKYKDGTISKCCYKSKINSNNLEKKKIKIYKLDPNQNLDSINTLNSLHVMFVDINDKYLEKVLVRNGAIVQEKLNKKTTVLVVDKLNIKNTNIIKAVKRKIPVVTIETFNNKITILMKQHAIKRISRKKYN